MSTQSRVENFNSGVDALIERGVLHCVLALTELQFSNSLIEVFWRNLNGELEKAKMAAQEARLEANRAISCGRWCMDRRGVATSQSHAFLTVRPSTTAGRSP